MGGGASSRGPKKEDTVQEDNLKETATKSKNIVNSKEV